MQNEIKFRTWDIKNNKFLTHRETIELVYKNNGSFEIDGYIIEQSTGIYDHDEKELFKGDIVAYQDEYSIDEAIIDYIKYEDGSFATHRVNYDDGEHELTSIQSMFHDDYDGMNFNIIGNIHENRELVADILGEDD